MDLICHHYQAFSVVSCCNQGHNSYYGLHAGWNTLFFLWGVFRGKKESCSQHMPESLEQFKAPQDMHPAIVSLPQNRCSLRPIGDHLPASEHAAPSPEVLGAEDLCSSLPSRTINGDCNTKISSLDQPDGGLILSSTVAVESDSAKQCQGPSTTSLVLFILFTYP